MYSRYIQIAASVLAFSLAACGGTDDANEGQFAMNIGFSDSALVADINVLRIAIHGGSTRNCVSLRGAPNANALFSEDITLSEDEKSSGGTKTFNSIAEGTYTVAIYGFANVNERPKAYGCEEALAVSAGKRTPIEVIINAAN